MSIKETLNRNPRVAMTAAVAVIVLAGLIVKLQLKGASTPPLPQYSFYTTDDGATFFKDEADKTPPFDHDGQPAVRAYVFTCGGGAPWVGYLEKYSDEARKSAAGGSGAGAGLLVKKPGAKQWLPESDFQKVRDIVTPKCPDGSGQVQPVMP